MTKTSLVKLVNLAEVTQISSALTVDAWVGADNGKLWLKIGNKLSHARIDQWPCLTAKIDFTAKKCRLLAYYFQKM